MILALLSLLTLWSTAPAQEAGGPERLALMIGVGDYPQTEEYQDFPPLVGCENDIELLSQVLVDRFGFVGVGKDIQWLLNEEATHKNVVAAIYELIQQADTNTEVLIYFSGHGSRLPDQSQAAAVEIDGKDSTFVVFDARSGEIPTPFDLTDDELFSLVQALCAKTDRVTLITDCCHSGGVVRGNPKQTARLAPEEELAFDPKSVTSFWPQNIPLLDDGDQRRRQDLSYVHLAACASDEVAREIEFEEVDRTYGVLTYYLVEELRKLEPGTTFDQLAARLKLRVASEVWDQSVQLEGARNRLVFGGGFGEPLPGFAATAEMEEGGYIDVKGGGLHLLSEDSEFEIQDLNGTPLGTAKVDEIDALTCTAVWTTTPESASSGTSETRAVRAIARTSWQQNALRIAVEDPLAGELAKQLQIHFGEGVEFVDQVDSSTAAKLVSYSTSGETGWTLYSLADGAELWSAPTVHQKDDMQSFQAATKREQLFGSLMNMSRARGGIDLKSSIAAASEEIVEELQGAWPDQKFVAAQSRANDGGLNNQTQTFSRLIDQQGRDLLDVAEIKVSFADSKRAIGAYISILCLSSDRTVAAIYPTDLARQNFLEPGDELSVPIEVFFNPGADPSAGVRDRYIAIATAEWVDFSALERTQPIHEAAQQLEKHNQESVKRGGKGSHMPEVLKQAFSGRRLRGPSSLEEGDWTFGLAAFDIQVFPSEEK